MSRVYIEVESNGTITFRDIKTRGAEGSCRRKKNIPAWLKSSGCTLFQSSTKHHQAVAQELVDAIDMDDMDLFASRYHDLIDCCGADQYEGVHRVCHEIIAICGPHDGQEYAILHDELMQRNEQQHDAADHSDEDWT